MNTRLLKRFLLPLSLPLVASFFACSDSSDNGSAVNIAGGPGSITTNGIMARVGGTPVANAKVSLHKVDYTAPEASEEFLVVADAQTETDSVGRFALDVPDSGEFRMTIAHDGVAFTTIVSRESYDILDTVADAVDLEATATVTGVADIPEGNKSVWVGVLGTDVLVRSDSNGVFVIPAIPANDSLQLYFMDEEFGEELQRKSVFLKPYEQVLYNYKSPVEVDSLESDSSNVEVDSLQKVSVRLEDGTPAAYATVALRKSDSVRDSHFVRNYMVAADVYADENGRFNMEWPKSGEYRLTVTSGSKVFSQVYSAKELSAIDSITLLPSVSFSSNVSLMAEEDFVWVGVHGLDELVKTDGVGNYVLPSLPASDSLVVYFVRGDGSEPFMQWPVKTSKKSASQKPSMLLYDFEEDNASWYMSVDTLWKGSTFYMNNGSNDATHLLKNHLELDSTRESNVFHAKYHVAFNVYAWVLLGTQLKETMNFAALDSVEFYAKGDGKIRLTIENWEDYEHGVKAASDWRSLKSGWTRYVFKPSELCFDGEEKEDCKTTWNGVKSQVKQIHIFPSGDGSEFFVDDVKLYGVLF